MSEIEYQIWTDGESFRIRSAMKHNWLFRTWTSYQWEGHYPYAKSYEEAEKELRKLFGQSARIAYRTWRQA